MDINKIHRVHNDGYIAIYYDDVYVGKTYMETSRYHTIATEIKVRIPDSTDKGTVVALTDLGCVIMHNEEQDFVFVIRTFYDDELKAIAWWYEARKAVNILR